MILGNVNHRAKLHKLKSLVQPVEAEAIEPFEFIDEESPVDEFTVTDFADMSASDQRSYLSERGIEPESNEKKRVAQFKSL